MQPPARFRPPVTTAYRSSRHPFPAAVRVPALAGRPDQGADRRRRPALPCRVEPTVTGRVIAAWPSFALIAAYELLMRQVRHGAARGVAFTSGRPRPQSPRREAPASAQSSNRNHPSRASRQRKSAAALDLQRAAWQWAQVNRAKDGSLPSGKEIGRQYGRHERWGRLVKRAGTAGEFSVGNAPDDRCGDIEEVLAAAAT